MQNNLKNSFVYLYDNNYFDKWRWLRKRKKVIFLILPKPVKVKKPLWSIQLETYKLYFDIIPS